MNDTEEKLFDALDEYIMQLAESMGRDIPNSLLKAEVLNFVDGYFEQSAYAEEQALREERLFDPDSFIQPERQ
jgi:hypothetical protein